MPHPPPLQIASPLRILVLSAPSTPLPPLLKDPILPLQTAYYTASIPIWHDDLPTSLPEWTEEWRSADAGEVVRAVGAWLVCFRKVVAGDGDGDGGEVTLPQLRASLTAISALIAHHASLSSSSYSFAPEPLLLAVGVHQPLTPRPELSAEEWEDVCRECGGWEWIDGEMSGRGRNEFGEKTGLARLLEALEANDWTSASAPSSPIPDRGSTSPPDFDFTLASASASSSAELGTAGLDAPTLRDLHVALIEECAPNTPAGREEGDEEDGQGEADVQVEELEHMMVKMQAARDKSISMPAAERPKFAASAVRDVLRRM